jgi:hypothetical protein
VGDASGGPGRWAIALVVGAAAALAAIGVLAMVAGAGPAPGRAVPPARRTHPTVPVTSPRPPHPVVLLDASGPETTYPRPFRATGKWTVDWSFTCAPGADLPDDHFLLRVADIAGVGTAGSTNLGLLVQENGRASDSGSTSSLATGTVPLYVTANCPWNVTVTGPGTPAAPKAAPPAHGAAGPG